VRVRSVVGMPITIYQPMIHCAGILHRCKTYTCPHGRKNTTDDSRPYWDCSFLASSKHMTILAMSARSTPGATVTAYCLALAVHSDQRNSVLTVWLLVKISLILASDRVIWPIAGPPSPIVRSALPPHISPESSIVTGWPVAALTKVASILVPTTQYQCCVFRDIPR
jgi:hypothetical protein